MIPAKRGLARDRKRKPVHDYRKPENKPEERTVTLCIAAECEHKGAPAIVMCCDWQSRTGNEVQGFVNADDAYKLREVKSASALLGNYAFDKPYFLRSFRACKYIRVLSDGR
jgi:hypothetical protein